VRFMVSLAALACGKDNPCGDTPVRSRQQAPEGLFVCFDHIRTGRLSSIDSSQDEIAIKAHRLPDGAHLCAEKHRVKGRGGEDGDWRDDGRDKPSH